MVVVVRLEVSDEDKRAFKKETHMQPSRKAIKAKTEEWFKGHIYPDGAPEKKKSKFKLTR